MSESIYQSLLDHETTAIVLIDNFLRVNYLNNAAETLLLTSLNQAKDRNIGDILICPELNDIDLLHALNQGQPYIKRASTLLISGEEISIDCTVTPFDQDGRHLVIEILPQDRWNRIYREENLIEQQAISRSLVRAFAHEIKNPLGGIRGAAQLLAGELSDQGLREYTDVIIAESDRLRNLVDQMLGPNKPFALIATNIHQVLERVKHLIESESQNTISVCRDYDPSIPELPGNQEQLIQAILNIAKNAVQSLMSDNSIIEKKICMSTRTARQLTIGNKRHKVVCQIDITDNGPGIDETLSDSIFYPMISNKSEGSGLGLTIAQNIINQHGGLIEFKSRPTETCFTIFLPFYPNGDANGAE